MFYMSVKHQKGDAKKAVGFMGVKLRGEVWAEHKFGDLWHVVGTESHRDVQDHLGGERK